MQEGAFVQNIQNFLQAFCLMEEMLKIVNCKYFFYK